MLALGRVGGKERRRKFHLVVLPLPVDSCPLLASEALVRELVRRRVAGP